MIPLTCCCEKCGIKCKNKALRDLDNVFMCGKCYEIAKQIKDKKKKETKWNMTSLETKKT
jgi:hypothetical protein